MTVNEMVEFAKEFLRNEYGLDLEIPIKVNNRLSRSNGRFLTIKQVSTNRSRAHSIEISGKILKYDTKDFVLGTLKHELVHYALFRKGAPYRDGDTYFENELKRVGAPSTMTRQSSAPRPTYRCTGCGNVHISSRRFNVNNYVSTCCRRSYEYEGLK